MVLQYLCNFEMVSKQGNSDGLKVTKSQDKKNTYCHTIFNWSSRKDKALPWEYKADHWCWWGHCKQWPRKGQEEIPAEWRCSDEV